MRCLSSTLQPWLDDFNRTLKGLVANGYQPTPTDTRKSLALLTGSLVTHRPEISWVRDDRVDTPNEAIPVRIYHPRPDAKLPVLVYLHGGGHMAGSVAVYDPICRKLAKAAEHIVVSVEYRLTPEHPYPTGIEDAYFVTGNLWPTLDRNSLNYQKHLSIAGDSGGGAMSATVAHWAQNDPAISIQRQVLIYPSLDYTLSFPSIETNGSGYLLEKSKIQWYFDHYFQHHEDRKKASPLFMEITSDLPETMVITAEFCPLRDEGMAYVDRIQSEGGTARLLHFKDMIHAFMNMEDLAEEACKTLYKRAGVFLNAP